METLRAWVLSLAGTSLLAAAVGALMPEGGQKRAFRAFCAVLFLYACLLPLRAVSLRDADLSALLTTDRDASQSFAAKEDDAALLAAQTLLETKIEETLAQNGLSGCEVTVRCASYDDGIAPETITVRGAFPAEKARALLQPLLTKTTALKLLTEEDNGG